MVLVIQNGIAGVLKRIRDQSRTKVLRSSFIKENKVYISIGFFYINSTILCKAVSKSFMGLKALYLPGAF